MVPVQTDHGSGLNIAEELTVAHSQLSGEQCPTQLLLPPSTSQSWKNSNPYNTGWGWGGTGRGKWFGGSKYPEEPSGEK